jgi:hypothetical protein
VTRPIPQESRRCPARRPGTGPSPSPPIPPSSRPPGSRRSNGRCGGVTHATIDNGTAWSTHRDLVLSTDRAARKLTVVDGNVSDSVKDKAVAIDAQGFVVPARAGRSGCDRPPDRLPRDRAGRPPPSRTRSRGRSLVPDGVLGPGCWADAAKVPA